MANLLFVFASVVVEMRRTTDDAAYAEKLQRQLGPGIYVYSAPVPGTPTVFPDDPWIRPQHSGATLSRQFQPVDVETNLRGLGLPLSRAPAGATSAGGAGHHHIDTNPVRIGGGGSLGLLGAVGNTLGEAVGWNVIPQTPVSHLQTTHARLELPALALKGLTVNRFDPVLYHNPAEKAFSPFDREVNTRMISKDQWRLPRSSLYRIGASRTTVGNPEGNIPPVYGNVPGQDPACQELRNQAVNEYMSKAVINEPTPPCQPIPTIYYTPPPQPTGGSAPLPSGFTNRSRFSSTSAKPLPSNESFATSSSCSGGVTPSEYDRKIVYHEPVPSC